MSVLFLLSLIYPLNCNQNNTHYLSRYPNIILLVGDDQGYPYFGFMGADYVYTPNMDKLAASGMLFTQGYVPANHCRPSLQTLITGTLPIQYEAQVMDLINEEKKKGKNQNLTQQDKIAWERDFRFHAMKYFRTLPRILSEVGYVSFQGGKWWEFNYQNGGFTDGMTTGWNKEDENQKDWFQKFMGGEGTELARATMQPAYDFIDQYSNSPFFMWFAPELPHYPFDAPDKYYNLYKDKNMSESAKRYYANCTWFDDGVGELIEYLKSKGEYDNTLFVYVNDNGWEQNPNQEFRHDSLRWHNGGDKGKLSMYDQSFRTPIIFSWQDKIPAAKSSTALMHSADILPTILDFIGVQIPQDIYGKSYKPIIDGNTESLREIIIGKIDQLRSEDDMMGRNAEGYWLREKEWFFNWNVTDNTKALFNVENDPLNDENLASKQIDLVIRYTQEIEKWKISVIN